uniref:Transmembrane protein n=1 Tax=viral metagenome TaxID=1070528 RepID=A0A6C0LFW2_9ZZZZ
MEDAEKAPNTIFAVKTKSIIILYIYIYIYIYVYAVFCNSKTLFIFSISKKIEMLKLHVKKVEQNQGSFLKDESRNYY